MKKILIIENDPEVLEILNVNLKGLGYSISFAKTAKKSLELLEKNNPNVVICDLSIPDSDEFSILSEIKKFDTQIQIILISDHFDINSALKAIEIGAFDYLQKPLDFNQLQLKISRALEIQSISFRLKECIGNDIEKFKLENNLIGKTPSMRSIVKNIKQLSDNRVSALLLGESGTGKELIAKSIHYSGISKEQPFIAINCSVLSEDLIESELFGHVKGAFREVNEDKKGKFELARKGTIFLDEISELSVSFQSKLLKVLREREFTKLGAEYSLPMNARILTASKLDIKKLVEEGKFLKDLYQRLKVFTITIPTLKERKEDIPLLVTYFLRKINAELHKKVNKVPIDVMDKLKGHDWPGNVRELENVLVQAVFLTNSDVLLCEHIHLQSIESKQDCNDYHLSLNEIEKRHILRVLDNFNWNKNKAIDILGISKPTLYSKVEKYNLKKYLK